MLTIRLQRVGKLKQPTYRLIVSEKARDTQAGNLENLGQYYPLNKENQINFNVDRIKHWLSVGAQTSTTVHNLLLSIGVISGKKQRSVFLSGTRKKTIADEKAKNATPAAA